MILKRQNNRNNPDTQDKKQHMSSEVIMICIISQLLQRIQVGPGPQLDGRDLVAGEMPATECEFLLNGMEPCPSLTAAAAQSGR